MPGRANQPDPDPSSSSTGDPQPINHGVQIAPGHFVPPSVLQMEYVRSGGPGGQNVNTRATKAILRVSIDQLRLTAGAVKRLRTIASRWLTDADELVIASDVHRTQERNREECLKRLREAIIRAKHRPKIRRKTKPSRGAIERRLRAKRERGEIKKRRKPPESS